MKCDGDGVCLEIYWISILHSSSCCCADLISGSNVRMGVGRVSLKNEVIGELFVEQKSFKIVFVANWSWLGFVVGENIKYIKLVRWDCSDGSIAMVSAPISLDCRSGKIKSLPGRWIIVIKGYAAAIFRA